MHAHVLLLLLLLLLHHHKPGFWSALRGVTGGALYRTSPSEAMCVIDNRSAETSKTVKAALPSARDVALFGQCAPSGQSPIQ